MTRSIAKRLKRTENAAAYERVKRCCGQKAEGVPVMKVSSSIQCYLAVFSVLHPRITSMPKIPPSRNNCHKVFGHLFR